jgi:hypothetical protein
MLSFYVMLRRSAIDVRGFKTQLTFVSIRRCVLLSAGAAYLCDMAAVITVVQTVPQSFVGADIDGILSSTKSTKCCIRVFHYDGLEGRNF